MTNAISDVQTQLPQRVGLPPARTVIVRRLGDYEVTPYLEKPDGAFGGDRRRPKGAGRHEVKAFVEIGVSSQGFGTTKSHASALGRVRPDKNLSQEGNTLFHGVEEHCRIPPLF